MRFIAEQFRLIELSYKGKKAYLYNEELFFNTQPNSYFTINKELTKMLLSRQGISTPKGTTATTPQEAVQQRKKAHLKFPVVVKPIDLWKGMGVHLNIKNNSELQAAMNAVLSLYTKKQSLNPEHPRHCLIEEMVPGNDHRVLVLRGKVIACVMRIPATLIGDGTSSIHELIFALNQDRPDAFQLIVDAEVRATLKRCSLKLSSILPKGQQVQVRAVANISQGGRAIDYTDRISARFKKVAIDSARTLGVDFVGIDLVTEDITSNNPKQCYAVIEMNNNPDYAIHEKPIVEGQGVNVKRLLIQAWMNK